jgi:NADH-quinone oxidoreductase subunit L
MEGVVVIVLLLAFASAMATHLSAQGLQRRSVRISVIGMVATFAITTLLLGLTLAVMPAGEVRLGASWGVFLFYPLSILMAFVVSGISLVVHLYSVRYMVEEHGYPRFFVLLDLMTAALLVMVSAGDLITLLIAWHLIGVLLYFLLGHDMASQSAHRYAA